MNTMRNKSRYCFSSSILFLFLLVMAVSACNSGSNGNQNRKNYVITIAGSTSVMPFTEKLAEYFMIDHSNYSINVQGGGSTAGIQSCLNKTSDIGMSSRELKEDEKELNKIVICYDGIALVTNRNNPVEALSLQQVKDIFNGKITNWKELGWIDRKIDAVTREEGSGTRSSFEDLVMQKDSIDDGIMVQDSNGSVKEVVATDPYAIGYISLGLVDKRVKAVIIDGVSPSIMNIKQKKYKIFRPFLYLTNGYPQNEVKKFIEYVLSHEGQSVLKREGLVSIND